jgi:predicted nuclease of predicted toxin-antitoxin system
MNIAVPVVEFLRGAGIDVVSVREEGWPEESDSHLLARALDDNRFVLTHDADFGELAILRGEPISGIIFLRPGGRPPSQVIDDLQELADASVDWRPPMIAVYQSGKLRIRRLSSP